MNEHQPATVECPLCARTVGARADGKPKMHCIPSNRLPVGMFASQAWCEGGNPLQNGMCVTPAKSNENGD